MKILFVVHADFEKPGAIATWANKHASQVDYCRPFAGEPLPKVNSFDWLVVMGGPQSPCEVDVYPYLQSEIELIRQARSHDKTILGFCLGAQLIGEAFDALTEPSPHKEVGVFPIHLTEAGCNDPLLTGLPSTWEVVHWHNDMPGLTPEAQILAKSEGCPRQIIRYSKKIYGFQCHPEPALEDIKGMIAHCPDDLKPGLYVQIKEALLASNFETINKRMHTILDNLAQM